MPTRLRSKATSPCRATCTRTPSTRRAAVATAATCSARWSRQWGDGSTADVQAYYDEQSRSDLGANGGAQSDRVRTVDVEAEHSFRIGTAHRIVWGAGYRTWTDRFVNTTNIAVLVPESQTLNLANIFAQDTIALREGLDLTLGAKYERNTFSGSAVMPSVRLGWQASAA